MNKSKVIHVRVEPDIKEKTEKIFNKLGLNTTQAFSLFLKQVLINNGLPFNVRIQSSEDNALASVISSLGGKAKVSKEREQIIELYSNGLIDYETACFAISRSFKQ